MSFILWIVFGALVGWIASLIMKTDKQQGAFLNIIIGITGSFIGGLVFNLFGGAGVTGFNIYSFIIGIIGAIILIWIVKKIRK